jgi:hypothetical protein
MFSEILFMTGVFAFVAFILAMVLWALLSGPAAKLTETPSRDRTHRDNRRVSRHRS